MTTAFMKKDATGVEAGSVMTYTGRWVQPLCPDWRTIDIEDIAHSLSNQCRFTGHTRHFYSVAQHSCLVSDILPRALALDGLLHDASEAYLSDIARPIKNQPEFGDIYRSSENRLMEAVCDKFGLDWDCAEMPLEVKAADNILLYTEMRDLLPPEILEGINLDETVPLKEKIKTWSPSRSKIAFLNRFYSLHGTSHSTR
jgi:uncharacterized protein